MGFPFEVVLLVVGLVLASPALKRRLEVVTATREARGLWTAAGVSPSEVLEHERIWGPAPEGPIELHSWMSQLEGSASVAIEWRRLDLDLRHALGWKSRGFTPRDVITWKGFTAITAEAWRSSGFSPGQARDWINEGFSESRDASNWSNGGLLKPHEAKRWKNTGFVAKDALKWVLSGLLDPNQAREWLSLNIDADEYPDWIFTTSSIAARWKSRGFSGEVARNWLTSGVAPDEALTWEAIGVRSDEVHAWVSWGSLDTVSNWRSAGIVSPYVARAWFDVGIRPHDAYSWIHGSSLPPNLAVSWVNAGWDVDRARPWLAVGLLDYGVALPWIVGGVSPGVASEWVREGLDFETAVAWLPTGVGPEVVREWVGCGVDPSRAAGWWEFGFRDPVVVAPLDREGCTPTEVGEWLAVGVSVEGVLEERRFWTPGVYARWSGLSGLDVVDARELSRRVGIEMVEGFLAVGADADVIVVWAGFPSVVETGPAWLAAGVRDPNLAVSWASHGFEPGPAGAWIRNDCEPVIAVELAKLGCRPNEWRYVRDVMEREGLTPAEAYRVYVASDIW